MRCLNMTITPSTTHQNLNYQKDFQHNNVELEQRPIPPSSNYDACPYMLKVAINIIEIGRLACMA